MGRSGRIWPADHHELVLAPRNDVDAGVRDQHHERDVTRLEQHAEHRARVGARGLMRTRGCHRWNRPSTGGGGMAMVVLAPMRRTPRLSPRSSRSSRSATRSAEQLAGAVQRSASVGLHRPARPVDERRELRFQFLEDLEIGLVRLSAAAALVKPPCRRPPRRARWCRFITNSYGYVGTMYLFHVAHARTRDGRSPSRVAIPSRNCRTALGSRHPRRERDGSRD